MILDKLNSAIAAIKAGDKALGLRLLSEIVRVEPSNETAWLWLSTCVDTVEQKKFCLTKALSINPNNQSAHKALVQLDQPPQPSFEEITSVPATRTTSSNNAPVATNILRPNVATLPEPKPIAEFMTPTPAPQSTVSIAVPTPPQTGLNTVATITIVLLVILGLYWLGIGLLQFSVAPSSQPNLQMTLFCVGIWNIIISIVNLTVIRDVMKRYKIAVRNLSFLAVVGSLWGMFALATGAWVQLCAIPMYILLGILVFVNKDYYTELTPKEIEKIADQQRKAAAKAAKTKR